MQESGETLNLITRRTSTMVNIGLQNEEALREAKARRTNAPHMNPGDTIHRGLVGGEWVVVLGEHGELRVELELCDNLASGNGGHDPRRPQREHL